MTTNPNRSLVVKGWKVSGVERFNYRLEMISFSAT